MAANEKGYSYCEYGAGANIIPVEEMKKMKIETKTDTRFEVGSATIQDDEDTEALFDTTGACILELDIGRHDAKNPKKLLFDLTSMLKRCRLRSIIYNFTLPGIDGSGLDGGGIRVYESSELTDPKLQMLYSTKARQVIQQFNETVTKQNSDSELEFVSLTRSACKCFNRLYITFKARQKGNSQIGTYQAALADAFFGYQLQLVLLRHVEADKILAILSLSGAEEELKKIYGF